MPIAVLDFEIANSNYNSACSVGIVVIDGLEVIKEEYSLIRPPGLVVDEAMSKIHGLTKRDLLSAPCFDVVWTKIKQYFNGDYIVAAHNAYFDVNVLHNTLSLVTEPVDVDFLYFDTIAYTSPVCKNVGASLADRLEFFSIPLDNAHNALEDARATAELIIRATQLKKLKSVEQYLLQHQVSTKKFTELKVTTEFRKSSKKLDPNSIGDYYSNITEQSQIKRLASAKTFQCTPISINKEDSSGVFQGSTSRYQTSLVQCECVDFSRNKKPCKHMYRLALELQVIEGKFESAIEKVTNQFSIEKSIALTEALTDAAQKILRDFLYQNIYQCRENYGFLDNEYVRELLDNNILISAVDVAALFDPFGRNELNEKIIPLNIPSFKKNFSKESLIEWAITTIPEAIPTLTAESIAVTINPNFNKTKKKLYSHLKKKYEHESILF